MLPRPLLAALVLALLLIPTHAEVILTQDFESVEGPTPFMPKLYTEPTRPDSILVVTDPVRSGKKALKIDFLKEEWKPGEPKRVEIYSNTIFGPDFMALHKDWWIGFSQYLPADWEADHENNPDVIWQFHGTEGGPSSNNPALSAVVFGDKVVIRLAQGTVPAERATSYADLATFPVPKGVWTDIVLNVHFDYKEGRVKIWRDGQVIVDYRGPTLYPMLHQTNEKGMGFKTGIYKFDWGNQPSKVTRRTLYLDEIRYGDEKSSYEEVAPRKSN